MRPSRTLLAFLLVVATAAGAASPPPSQGRRGMVAAPEPAAAAVGIEILRRGGSAADAAVATAFALSVTYPLAGSLGGGGFALLRDRSGRSVALDFRETGPAGLRPERFLDEEGNVVPARATESGLGVGVPGLPAGLARLHAEGGVLPWRQLLVPAIRLAEEGVPLSRFQAQALAREADRLRRRSGAAALFFRADGAPLGEGDRLVQPALARTLRRIADDGPEGFYRGPVAEDIATAVRREGGVLEPPDLARYRVEVRRPLVGTYRGRTVVAFPPPSSGGIAVLQILGILEGWDLAGSGPVDARTVHLLAEAARRAFADRSRWLGDPAFVDVPVARLLDKEYLAERAASIDEARATPVRALPPPGETGGGETLHLSVADSRGSVVAATITSNFWFGSGIVAPESGVLLNNEMADFTLSPSTPDPYGLTGTGANLPGPGKRPVSSMSPTIVLEKETSRPRIVLGSPGGPTIISTVVQVISRVIDHGMNLQEAVDTPRFHHQGLPDRIDHERFAFPEEVARALRERGHVLQERDPIGSAEVIGWDSGKAVWTGAADPRRDGAVRGY